MSSEEESLPDLLRTSDENLIQSASWFEAMVCKVNDLINTDFAGLLSILYQLDVSEQKLKELLVNNPSGDAATLIAGLIVERQLQRIETRRNFRVRPDDATEEERW
jgi:hypothetical protein